MVTWRRQRLVDEGRDARLVTDEDDVDVVVLAGPVDGPAHDLLGCVVATHGIDGHTRSVQIDGSGLLGQGFDVHVRRLARSG